MLKHGSIYIALHPWKPEGLLGQTAQDGHLDSHTAPELWQVTPPGRMLTLVSQLQAFTIYKDIYITFLMLGKEGTVIELTTGALHVVTFNSYKLLNITQIFSIFSVHAHCTLGFCLSVSAPTSSQSTTVLVLPDLNYS